ncbi:MAG: PilZ domain-containing protein [Planctomycetes bacterium]|nr:PilZ domain-containing protein [Planctomycetota bacterium]
MSNAQALNPKEISDVMENTVESGQICVMSHLTKGKWHRIEVKIHSVSQKSIMLELLDSPAANTDIQIDQPVGMSFEVDFIKYLFESTVIGFEPAVNQEQTGRIMIKKPISIEKMKRRSYKRVPIPDEMKVNTLFWHRGYTDDSTEVPIESYWQGRMLDLSAGGAQITVTRKQFENFKQDQYIGMQFTPLPFEKPVLLEGQIKHIAAVADDTEMISLGIEFLGLEASTDGREKLDKIVETIGVYQKNQATAESFEESYETLKN